MTAISPDFGNSIHTKGEFLMVLYENDSITTSWGITIGENMPHDTDTKILQFIPRTPSARQLNPLIAPGSQVHIVSAFIPLPPPTSPGDIPGSETRHHTYDDRNHLQNHAEARP